MPEWKRTEEGKQNQIMELQDGILACYTLPQSNVGPVYQDGRICVDVE